MEMMRELGYCNGIENYSRILDGRAPGEPPFTLLDYFPDDFLVIVDESHNTVPADRRRCTRATARRKTTLVEHGFRLPSALDNRPLRFDEFIDRVPQAIFVSATPGPFELRQSTAGGRADHPADRPRRPRGRRAADAPPDRRPARRDPPRASAGERVLSRR